LIGSKDWVRGHTGAAIVDVAIEKSFSAQPNTLTVFLNPKEDPLLTSLYFSDGTKSYPGYFYTEATLLWGHYYAM